MQTTDHCPRRKLSLEPRLWRGGEAASSGSWGGGERMSLPPLCSGSVHRFRRKTADFLRSSGCHCRKSHNPSWRREDVIHLESLSLHQLKMVHSTSVSWGLCQVKGRRKEAPLAPGGQAPSHPLTAAATHAVCGIKRGHPFAGVNPNVLHAETKS